MKFLMSKDEIMAYQKEIWEEMGNFIPSHFDSCGLRNIEKYGEKLGCSTMDDVCVFIKQDNYEIDTGYNDEEVYQDFAVFRKNDYQELVDQAASQQDKIAIGTIDAIRGFYLDNAFCLADKVEEGKSQWKLGWLMKNPVFVFWALIFLAAGVWAGGTRLVPGSLVG
jgi:hypothetical protein